MSENVTDFEQKINNINVCLKTGNVAAEDADCIVVPEFRDGASGGGVGYAIETAGMGAGLEAYEKVAQEGFLKDGDAIITESGKPDVKLAHVVTVSAREDSQFEVVNRSVLKTLETANEVGIKRIALPEIGTGIIGSLTQEQSAKAIFNAVYEFSKNNPSSSVEEVSFVVYRSSTEPAKRVLTDKSYIGIMTAEKSNKSLDLEEFVEGLGNHGVRKKAKSPTREEILQDPEARKITGFKMTKLFYAETREAVDAYIEAGVDINHPDMDNETALDWCIDRVVRGINTYEDSDNKGAVLQMALKGGKCSELSLDELKAKDPELHTRVVSVMKTRERLHELGAKIVTDTKYPLSGHTDNPLKKVNQPENLTLIKDGTKHEILHELPTHEEIHRRNQRAFVMEPGVKPTIEKPTPRYKQDNSSRIAEVAKQAKLIGLMKEAITINRTQGTDVLSIDELCRQMVEAATTSPVKAVDEEFMFVIEKGANLWEALSAWKEQALKPKIHKQIKEKPKKYPAVYVNRLETNNDRTKIDCTSDSFYDAAMTELLVTKYPEHADKITLLQLINAYDKAEIGSVGQAKINEQMDASTKKYMSGEEVFPLTLQNVVTFNENNSILLLSSAVNISAHDLEKRTAETELKMLKSLQPEDLEFVSDRLISEGSKIAEKHKDAGDFDKLFAKEIKSRLAQGKIFDPRDPKD